MELKEARSLLGIDDTASRDQIEGAYLALKAQLERGEAPANLTPDALEAAFAVASRAPATSGTTHPLPGDNTESTEAKDDGPVRIPRPVAVLAALIAIIGGIITILGAPGWTLGASAGALIAIPVFHRSVWTWPTSYKSCALVGLVIAVGAVGGLVIEGSGRPQTKRSSKSDVAATGYIGGRWIEQEAEGAVETFHVPVDGSSKTKHPVRPLELVHVSCQIYVAGVPTAHPKGYWYRLAGSPWRDKAYAPANAFWNRTNVISGPGVKYRDPQVPMCE